MKDLIEDIKEAHRQRTDYMRMENQTILRMRAICRRNCSHAGMELAEVKTEADKLYDSMEEGQTEEAIQMALYLALHIETRDRFHKLRMEAEGRMKKLSVKLQVYPWVQSVMGFGELGLAQIVAEAGNLENYANPAKLWKRFGLAPYNGHAPSSWRMGRCGKLTAKEWEDAGYSPRRRSIMFVIGDSLIKKQGFYRNLYLWRKQREKEKTPDQPKMAHHRRAQRYVEKRLLRNLWQAWVGQEIINDDLSMLSVEEAA